MVKLPSNQRLQPLEVGSGGAMLASPGSDAAVLIDGSNPVGNV